MYQQRSRITKLQILAIVYLIYSLIWFFNKDARERLGLGRLESPLERATVREVDDWIRRLSARLSGESGFLSKEEEHNVSANLAFLGRYNADKHRIWVLEAEVFKLAIQSTKE